MNIITKNRGYEKAVTANNECKNVIFGYYGDDKFLLDGVYNGSVENNGQMFEISQPFSKNIKVILTVYVKGDFEKAPKSNHAVVKVSKVDVRTGHSTKYKKVGTLKKNAKVYVEATFGSWSKIIYKKESRYIPTKTITYTEK